MAVRDRHSRKASAGKFDPRGGDIEEVERMIRWHERKRADDLEFLDRFHPSAEFPPNDVTNSIAEHDREIKKLQAKYSRLTMKRKGNPMPRKKKIRRGKATPAQLRALKKAHAALRKKRAATKKTTRRRNPAYAAPGYAKARQVARGSHRPNPVRKLAPLFAIKSGARYFDGVRFSAKVSNAARFATLAHCKNVAQKIADATGKTCAIVNLRK